jgi:hypothetical protein
MQKVFIAAFLATVAGPFWLASPASAQSDV